MTDQLVKSYFDSVPPNRKERIHVLHNLIIGLFPKAQVSMKYKMPTYESEQGWTAVANQKNYVSLYTCGPHHLETFKKQHPKIKTGKGCINFKDSDNISLEDLKPVINSAMTDNSH